MPEAEDSDLRLALAAIAAELNVEVDELPPSIKAIVAAFGAQRYNNGRRSVDETPTRRTPTKPYMKKVID